MPNLSKGVRISVAMATYNGEQQLQEQLRSLETQRLLPHELVVTDDGSTDATIALLERFALQAPFPVLIHKNPARLGYADNFLRAASLCSGDCVAFCDQDDVWLETKLEVCAEYLDRSAELGLVVHSADTWDGKERLGKRFPSFEQVKIWQPGALDSFALIPGFAMVFRRHLLDLVDNGARPGCIFGIDNGSIMAHDGWVWLLATSTMEVATLPDVLALYRQHASNTVGAPRKRGLLQKIGISARPVNYAALTRLVARASIILAGLPLTMATNRKSLELVVKRLQRLAKMHQYRANLYDDKSTFLNRFRSFWGILFLGGYLPDRTKASVGPKAALKDLSFGVPGLFKRFTPDRQPSSG